MEVFVKIKIYIFKSYFVIFFVQMFDFKKKILILKNIYQKREHHQELEQKNIYGSLETL